MKAYLATMALLFLAALGAILIAGMVARSLSAVNLP